MKLPFDKIYCLQLAENKNRHKKNVAEFEKVGILDQIEYWWAVKRPFLKDVTKIQPNLICDFYDTWTKYNSMTYANVANCAIEHYSIVKQAYERGFERILIIEDDVEFKISAAKLEIVMSNTPSDFDLIAYQNGWRRNYKNHTYLVANDENLAKYRHIKEDISEWRQNGTVMYAISRNMMKFVIDYYDTNGLTYADKFLDYIDRNEYKVYEPCCNIIYTNINDSTINYNKVD